MHRSKKCVLIMIVFTLLIVLGYNFAPKVFDLMFGPARVGWISERLSETLREKSELVIYEVEVTAQETVTQEAWLIGTVQKIEIPYTFSIRYTIDLSKAEVTTDDHMISIVLPKPKAQYAQLTVDEDRVKKQDWLYPLSLERYDEIKKEIEHKLVEEYSNHEAYLEESWTLGRKQVEGFFEAIIHHSLIPQDIYLEISQQLV